MSTRRSHDSGPRKPLDPKQVPVANESVIPPEERVFCNRKLKMSRIRAIGFDMDHTLGVYNGPEIEELAYRCTIEKLIEKGYPERLRELVYEPELAIRGLVVDKDLGNLIKLDRYKYVTVAYHGTRRITYEERKAAYSNRRLDLALPAFHNLDTLFTIPEAVLYAQMVDLVESGAADCRWEFRPLFDDIRASIDCAHRDGTLKAVVLADLARFFIVDPDLPLTLKRMRRAGKKVFLLTNSERSYTEAVMSFILPPGPKMKTWHEYFDLICVASRKPGFFAEGTPLEFEEVEDGPKVFSGGNVQQLEAILGCQGEEVLYFGDHTYGDIMRSKKYSLWRTAMICEELESELQAAQQTRGQRRKLARLYTAKSDLQDRVHVEQERIESLRARKLDLRGHIRDEEELERVDQKIRDREKRLRTLDSQLSRRLLAIRDLEVATYSRFNRYWGRLFRSGTEMSRVGDQIEDFACVYTSKVSNFVYYPVNKYFTSPRDRMVHEIS